MRQLTSPMMLRGGTAAPLHRVPFAETTFPESWLQKLLFDHPELLPLEELEPTFRESFPVARELPTSSGPLDLLLVNEGGHLTLVETKLWRNPEARRAVVAQLVDYAKCMAKWSYTDLAGAVQKATGSAASDPLLVAASERYEDLDEREFADGVSRCLRRGRFLMLIVGDGIREDAEDMVEFLQQTPQLGFTLALVEMGLYREHPESDDPLLVQPRVLARTSEVTRAIVEIRTTVAPNSVGVTVPTEEAHGGGRTNITEQEFLESLATHAGPAATNFARWILAEAPDHGLEISWKAAGPLLLYREPESGATFNLGQLRRQGRLRIDRLFGKCKKLGLPPEICRAYLDEVAAFIPGASRRFVKTTKGEGYEQVATSDAPAKGQPLIAAFADKGPAWFAAIERFKQTITEEFAGRED